MKFALFLDSFCHKNQEEICWTCLDHRNGSRLVNNYQKFIILMGESEIQDDNDSLLLDDTKSEYGIGSLEI